MQTSQNNLLKTLKTSQRDGGNESSYIIISWNVKDQQKGLTRFCPLLSPPPPKNERQRRLQLINFGVIFFLMLLVINTHPKSTYFFSNVSANKLNERTEKWERPRLEVGSQNKIQMNYSCKSTVQRPFAILYP